MIEKYRPPITLGAPKEVQMALDEALEDSGYYTLLQHAYSMIKGSTMPQFLGYGVLTGLMQNQVIRSGVEMLADEMTREWIDTDKDTENELINWKAQKIFREAFALTGYLGGCLVYIDTLGDYATDSELRAPLYFDRAVFAKGALKGLQIIEPFNVSPGAYQSSNALRKDYFKPQTWWVRGKEVHRSRFLYFAHNLPSTLFLPAYNFFGMPISQLVLDAVTHFTETRESTARALKKYSLTVFKTPMAGIEQKGAFELLNQRLQFLADKRDNDGIEVIDADKESIETVVSPISGMTDIVRQAMDVVAASFGEPTVKLWGITPSGLNSSGDADLANHYDHIMAMQEAVFREPLTQLIRVLRWNKGFDDVDADFTFNPLGALNEETKANVQNLQANRDMIYLANGVLLPEEVRAKLNSDKGSGYVLDD